MPGPITRTDPATGETREWNGSQWVASGGTSTPNMPMIHMPPGVSGGVDGSELLKQLLTTGGAVGGSFFGPGGTILGAAAGRAAGHIPEALTTAATGEPNDSSFGGDLAEGAGEGAIQEALPWLAGPILRGGGRAASWLGTKTGGGGYSGAFVRGTLGRMAGGDLGMAGAVAGPPILKAGGDAAVAAGERMGTKTLSQHMQALRGVEEAVKPPTTLSNLQLPEEAVRRNINAENMLDEGYTRSTAGQLEGIPGAGKSKLDAVTSKPNTPNGLDQSAMVEKTLADLSEAKARTARMSGREFPKNDTQQTWQDSVDSYYKPKVGLDYLDMGGDRNVPPSSSLIDAIYPPELRGLAGLRTTLEDQMKTRSK